MRRPPKALREFLEPYGPTIARLFFAARKGVLDAAPQANELIYDAYNAVTAAYSFTDRLKEAFCHVAAYRAYANLGFNRGAELPDPDGLLVGKGSGIRHIRISTVTDLQRPGVQILVRAAVQQGRRVSGSLPERPQSVVQAIYARKRRPSGAKQ